MRWLVLIAVLAGCKIGHEFRCLESADCRVGSTTGTCELTGYCSFPDSTCTSGSRYDTDSGALGGTCVPDQTAIDAGIDAPPVDAAFPPYLRQIHIAGAQVVGTDYPGTWEADLSNAICPGSAQYNPNATDINGTVDDVLFATSVFSGTLACHVPGLPAGRYRVSLPLAEIFFGCAVAPQDRVQSVTLEGTNVGMIDFVALGGGCAIAPATGHPFVVTYDVDVTDGTLDLVIAAVAAGSATLMAIAIERIQ